MAYSTPGKTRQRVFEFVSRRLLAGNPPTVREVQQAFGFKSVESARNHLETLVREGRLVKEPGRSRGYRLAGEEGGRPPVAVPVLGRVAAGGLEEALDAPENHISVQTHHPPEELFALRVRGRSMVGAGILPGDLVVVRRQPTADSGDIVVAMSGSDATVKQLKLRGRRVELHPANPRFKPIVLEPDAVNILGKVIELRRDLE
jgi:repressor LexA